MASTTRPASSGVATASAEVTTLSARKAPSWRRRGLAKPRMRSSTFLENGRFSCCAVMVWYSVIHADVSMLIAAPSVRPACSIDSGADEN
jgi:hypothetical protein